MIEEPYIETLFDGKMKAWTNMVRNVTANMAQYKKPFKVKNDAVKLGCQAASVNGYKHQIRAKDAEIWETCPNH